MREAGAARLLVLRSDVIPELKIDERRRMVFLEDDGEAVRQRGDFVLQLRRPHGRRTGDHLKHGDDDNGGGNLDSHVSSIIALAAPTYRLAIRNPANTQR